MKIISKWQPFLSWLGFALSGSKFKKSDKGSLYTLADVLEIYKDGELVLSGGAFADLSEVFVAWEREKRQARNCNEPALRFLASLFAEAKTLECSGVPVERFLEIADEALAFNSPIFTVTEGSLGKKRLKSTRSCERAFGVRFSILLPTQ